MPIISKLLLSQSEWRKSYVPSFIFFPKRNDTSETSHMAVKFYSSISMDFPLQKSSINAIVLLYVFMNSSIFMLWLQVVVYQGDRGNDIGWNKSNQRRIYHIDTICTQWWCDFWLLANSVNAGQSDQKQASGKQKSITVSILSWNDETVHGS